MGYFEMTYSGADSSVIVTDSDDKPWDVFAETAWENLTHADREFWTRVNIVSRLALIIFLFLFILVSSSLATFSFLVISYNMNAAGWNFSLDDVNNQTWVNWLSHFNLSGPHLFHW